MYDLYINLETIHSGYNSVFLTILHVISIFSGILTIVSKNPVISVLFLITLFFIISGYFVISGLSFLGISYLLVYIGAVTILFLFILMLMNIRISELTVDNYNTIPLAIIITVLFIYPFYGLFPNYNPNMLYEFVSSVYIKTILALVTSDR